MSQIRVIDDFFPENIREEIYNLTRYSRNWCFNGGNKDQRFWHLDGLEEEHFFNTFLFELICNELNQNLYIKRIYANGQTANQSGSPHYDDGDLTFLYYPNPKWKLKDQGQLFFLEGDEISNTVLYKPNRAVVFPSDVCHYANAPSSSFSGLRVSLAYKLMS